MERDGELLAQQLEHLARPLLPAGRETPERHPAGEHGPRAEGERRGDVGAAPDAAVEQHLEPVADRVDDGRQRLERRHRAVELAAAVVRDDDARGAVLGRAGRHPRGRGCP